MIGRYMFLDSFSAISLKLMDISTSKFHNMLLIQYYTEFMKKTGARCFLFAVAAYDHEYPLKSCKGKFRSTGSVVLEINNCQIPFLVSN